MALSLIRIITDSIIEHSFIIVSTAGIVFLAFFILHLVRLQQRIRLEKLLGSRINIDQALGIKDCEKRMKELAVQHKVIKFQKQNSILKDLNQISYKHLNSIRSQLEKASPKIIALIPAARWLFDNSYLLFRELRKSDDFRYNKMLLPILSGNVYKNFPRIYIIAREMVIISGKHIKEENISAMIEAYQSVEPLTSAELWILLDMIKLCLLENTISTAHEILSVIQTKTEADQFVQETLTKMPEKFQIDSFISTKTKKENLSSSIFLSHVLYCLKTMSIEETIIVQLVEQWAGSYENPTSIILNESRFESGLESVIRALIVSFRETNSINGEELFERLSPIEKILGHDPAKVYNKMDFDTRNRYRLEVEKLARRYKTPEWKMAQKVLRLTESHKDDKEISCSGHVGTYLVGRETHILKAALVNKSPGKTVRSGSPAKPFYPVVIVGFTFLWFTFLLWTALQTGHSFQEKGVILFLIAVLFPVIGIAVELANIIFTHIVPPKILPCLDFQKEIPDDCRTIVVMPVILSSGEQAKQYAARLEKYHFSNTQSNLYFAILADFCDASTRTMPQDDEILNAASNSILALNNKYHSSNTRFLLFFRYRKWNEAEDCWMGWERKRGKLEEFNALLAGSQDTTFTILQGDKSILASMRYVITIDADTDLIRDSAAKLVGTIAHPLNHAVIDQETSQLKEGYAIIQSEIRNHITDASSCLFSKTFSGQQGLDPYSNVIADIYQDTFGEGIFVGKGIYDIGAVNRLLSKAFPENSVLSHDLLESCYARCAFASGIKLMDTFPASVFSYTKREHRWIRGDWQLLPWLFGRGKMNGVSRWKIFDNLRRSLIPFCRLLAIVFSALFLPDIFWLWLPVLFFDDVFHLVLTLLNTLIEKLRRPKYKISTPALFHLLSNLLRQAGFGFVLMPYRACISLDAIGRTLYRLTISHKHLLQWQTMESLECQSQSLSGYTTAMWSIVIPVFAVAAAGVFSAVPAVMIVCLALAALWASSPAIAYRLSRAVPPSIPEQLKSQDIRSIRLIARRTWQYFKDFATPQNNWLCPDNYQIAPSPKVSGKTSPTNIGLQLLSLLSARDLGYTSLLTMMEYCENILYTLAVLPKWHGHLYNWYDINSLEILSPQYVSTVDSGNFIGYMIALKNGLLSLLNQPIYSETAIEGIRDTIALAGLDLPFPSAFATVADFMQALRNLEKQVDLHSQHPWENQMYKKALIDQCRQLLRDAAVFGAPDSSFAEQNTLKQLAWDEHSEAAELVRKIKGLARSLNHMIKEANFKVLFDSKRLLFHIGYHEASKTLDSSYYDLMASESALTSLLAIAKGNAPKKHWFYLARPLTMVRGIPAFVSWSGTMFEYLMPGLVMREHPYSVFSQTADAAITEQIRYAKSKNIPWGMSESQYFRFDINSNYQYKAFGVPRLKLQPSVSEPLVIAPYATFLAMHHKPRAAIRNIQWLQKLDVQGDYGLYEAVDFNSPDPQSMRRYSIVKCFMAHHQGMSLIAINNLLNNNIMQQRFHSEPMIRGAEILLEEMRGSIVIPVERKGYSIQIKQPDIPEEPTESRFTYSTRPAYPSAHWLSNRQYSLLLTSDGDGFSRYQDIWVNRWRPDKYASAGSYIYLRDASIKKFWSAAFKPTMVQPDEYQVEFSHSKAEYRRRDEDIETQMSITLSPSQNFEVRRITLINNGHTKRVIELTSYMEVVFDQFLAELYHPAFSKLFMESEYVPEDSMLLLRKRKKTISGERPFLAHMIKTKASVVRNLEYETDRLRFLGRNNTLENPAAMLENIPLSSHMGFSIDPIFSLRISISIPPGQAATVSFITGVFQSRKEAADVSIDLDEQYHINHVFEQFRLNSELEMKYLSVSSQKVNAYQDLVGPIFYSFMPFRGPAESIERNWKNQSFLWRYGISGDNPMLVLKVQSTEEIGIVKEVLRAYEYFRINQMKVDLIILNEEPEGYMQDLDNLLAEMISTLKVYNENIVRPSLFILRKSQMEEKDLDLLFSVASIVFSDKTGINFSKIRESIRETQSDRSPEAPKKPLPPRIYVSDSESDSFNPNIEYFNSFGGFVNDGQEYEIRLDRQHRPPKPWINVIANERFGFQISESGAGYTWSVNSRENKLTPWFNDPVADPIGEAIYVQDVGSRKTYLPAPLSNVQSGSYIVRHGFGYSVFERSEPELFSQMTVYVDTEDPVRLWKLDLTNTAGMARHFEITLYVEWVLGVDRALTYPYIVTEYNRDAGCLMAKSVYNYHFRNYSAFLFSSEPLISYTGDREEFLGRLGSAYYPEGLLHPLQDKTGAGLDPCGAIRISVNIRPGDTKELIFGLGQSNDPVEIEKIVFKYRDPAQAQESLHNVRQYWESVTKKATVASGSRALDILANGWLLYQTLSCRIKARAAMYQCGGAFGFRDQLQDSLAFLDVQPEIVKRQILLSSTRQFEEGDVQHWWHPPVGLGVRTRISDDLLWLPYVTAAYVAHTGDASILDEVTPYISGPLLGENEHEAMYIPNASERKDSIYSHCVHAILHAKLGEHGLPLMGGGDWNDGMNRVGIQGRGESVWLGWFLYAVYTTFLPLCHIKNDKGITHVLEQKAAALAESLETNAWDGEWYLRAYYDDGQKLGSIENDECRIDSISQSWSAISGAAPRDRTMQALYSARQYLVHPREGVSLLLTPPFDKTPNDPGYIKDYYPGIRENGGQYTHAAVWLAIAHMAIKESTAAADLLGMLNPILLTATQQGAMQYEKEPYAMTADISMGASYTGWGGWSWYTGSSSWMYQAIIYWFLGIRRQGPTLLIDPSVPPSFGEYTVTYHHGSSLYNITVKGGFHAECIFKIIRLDGIESPGNSFALVDDGKTHTVIFWSSEEQL